MACTMEDCAVSAVSAVTPVRYRSTAWRRREVSFTTSQSDAPSRTCQQSTAVNSSTHHRFNNRKHERSQKVRIDLMNCHELKLKATKQHRNFSPVIRVDTAFSDASGDTFQFIPGKSEGAGRLHLGALAQIWFSWIFNFVIGTIR